MKLLCTQLEAARKNTLTDFVKNNGVLREPYRLANSGAIKDGWLALTKGVMNK